MSQHELEDPIEENIMKETDKEEKEKEKEKDKDEEDNRSVVLQLGDVIRLAAPTDDLVYNSKLLCSGPADKI